MMDQNYLGYNDVSMDSCTQLPVAMGLGEYSASENFFQFDIDELLNVSDNDILTSPGPHTITQSFEDAMDTGLGAQLDMANMAVASPNPNPVTLTAVTSNTTAMATTTPVSGQANAFANGNPNSEGRVDSVDMSYEGIEPSVRIDSMEIRRAMAGCPTLFDERFSSLELPPTRTSSGKSSETLPRAVVPPSPRPGPVFGQSPSTELRTSNTVQPAPVTTTAPAAPRPTHTSSASGPLGPRLPESHEFKVVVNFLNVRMVEETITEPTGCLLFYERRDQPATSSTHLRTIPIRTSRTMQRADGSVVQEELPWQKENHKKYTEMLLRSFDKGITLCSKEGNIYAKRHCNTKLFWTNTQRNDEHAVELAREKETEVFNWRQFEDSFKDAYTNGKQNEVRLPTIQFSFAQKWDVTSCPLNTKLVSARVEPMKASEMVRWVNPDVQPASHYDSMHTSLFHYSNTSSQASH